MKVVVEFTNEAHTTARILVVPNWLSRLFGARARVGDAKYEHCYWRWSTTGHRVTATSEKIERAIELQDVEPLPRVRLVEGARIENCSAGGDIIAISNGKRRS